MNTYWFNTNTKRLYTVSPGNITAPSIYCSIFLWAWGWEEPYQWTIHESLTFAQRNLQELDQVEEVEHEGHEFLVQFLNKKSDWVVTS
jgi:hypothetical protein